LEDGLMPDVLTLVWACGQSNGGLTAVYAMPGDGLDRILLGMMGSWELADAVVRAHNESLVG
jgi:hypothetical protein